MKSMEIGKSCLSFGGLNDVDIFRFDFYDDGSVLCLNVIHVK
jgi:hypothetical protein